MGVAAITEKNSEGEKGLGLSPGNPQYFTAEIRRIKYYLKKRRTDIREHGGADRLEKNRRTL